MSEVDIYEALQVRYEAFRDLDDHACKYPNREFKPTVGTPWDLVLFIPNKPRTIGYGNGATTEHKGIFQVSVVYPEDTGIKAQLARAQSLVDHFWPTNQQGLALTSNGQLVRIDEKPTINGAYTDKGWSYMPVSVRYYAHTIPA